jgi:hypothetical protein
MTRIAELHIDAKSSDGERRNLYISISQPEPDPKDLRGSTFRTLLEFEGYHKPKYIYGEGSLQSLTLTISLLKTLLEMIADDGWTLYHPDSDEIATPDLNLFGNL